jgi:hypothetical protein
MRQAESESESDETVKPMRDMGQRMMIRLENDRQ